MIAAQWEPFLRLAQSVGTVLALIGVACLGAAMVRGSLGLLDAWRHHRCPEHALIHQRQQLDAWFKAESKRT